MDALEMAAIELRTSCPRCGLPAPINTVTQAVRCAQCASDFTVPSAIWREAVLGVEDDVVNFGRGYTRPGPDRSAAERLPPGCKVEWVRGRDAPRCAKCGERMRLDIEHDACACASCKEIRAIEAAPKWLTQLNPAVIGYVSDDDAEPERSAEPVGVACTQCGGPLLADGSTRMVPCGFCKVKNVLPDAVWSALHPPRVTRRHWLLVRRAEDPRRSFPKSPGDHSPADLFAHFNTAIAIGPISMFVFIIALVSIVAVRGADAIPSYVLGILGLVVVGWLVVWWRRIVVPHRKRATKRALLSQLCRPENEVIARLRGPVARGRVRLILTPPGRPSEVLHEMTIPMTRSKYAVLGGDGAPIRAFMKADSPDMVEVLSQPSIME